MHIVIDILAGIVLLFFLLAGWHKGFLLSILSVVRVILAYGVAFFSGRYIGSWLGEVAHRPRIVTIPVIAGLTFIIITFIFHVVMTNIRDNHKEKEEKENYSHPWYSALSGAAINLFVGLFSMIFLFWLGDVFSVGATGKPIPGSGNSKFASLARRGAYEAVYLIGAREGRESQAAASARVISNPALGMRHLENLMAAETIQTLVKDRQFAEDLLSGDAGRIESNASLQALFNDTQTLEELKALGFFSGREKKSELCQSLSRFGSNEKIQASLQSLKERDLLSTDKITLLIRDPEFDVIIGEVLK
ncbi:CvpA family protein [Pontiella agarivorans]|uniref:CvpA family protein n=1 Tax=Pontiella agarivorans TaxID=3038953 RepID=A0ABU5MYR5_9BACT|nr:CvpA family protein [Pontiella agarivorans]MDZ8119346.1 CvpA family protein [Pontiella agarivorans]